MRTTVVDHPNAMPVLGDRSEMRELTVIPAWHLQELSLRLRSRSRLSATLAS